LVFGGIVRHYLVVVPGSYDGTIAAPVVLAFHGKNNDGALSERTFGFTELQNRDYFIAVYPDGLNREWNGGLTPPASRESEVSDDVGFVSALIDSLSARYKIDPKRIFATGSSNGAIFCHTLAARLSERIAAIGPVNGNLGVTLPKKFPPQHPVSVISFNGTDDKLVPFGGESDPVYGLCSMPETIAFWVKVDGCVGEPEVATLSPAVPDDGTVIKRFTFGKGPTGAEVVAYVIGHGGHTWPGNHTDPGWAKIAGRTSMGVKATEAIWGFFEQHPKP
jgi:polyhydroxybutyrate depolymerase